MFTINIYLKFALIALFLIGGILLAIFQGFWYSLPLLLIGIGLLASYFLLGTIQSASQYVQDMDFDAADKRLDLTVKPSWLYVTNRAIYYILKGTISSNKGDQKTAESLFNQALELKLPSDNETGMVLMQLATIQGNKGNFTGAKNYFNRIKKLNITEPQIKSQVDYMEKALSQSNASRKATRGMGKRAMSQGGKRRRPKMR